MDKRILIIIIALVLAISGYFLLRGGYQAPAPGPVTPEKSSEVIGEEEVTLPPSPEVKEVTVVGTEFAFSPASITVRTGEKVKLTFQNSGGTPHNLVIEELGISTKTIGSGKTDTIEFTAPQTGTYAIFCSIPGHRVAGMEGSLIIE